MPVLDSACVAQAAPRSPAAVPTAADGEAGTRRLVHALNNNLALIMCALELFQSERADDQELDAWATETLDRLQRMAEDVERLRRLALS